MGKKSALSLSVNDEIQLQLLESWHVKEYFALIERNRAYLRHWMSWIDAETSLAKDLEFIQFRRRQFEHTQGCLLGIWYQGYIVGSLGLHTVNWENRKAEIGYWLDAEMQGKGVMHNACSSLISYSFREYQLNKVEIHCATENKSSRGVPERLGFTLEGVIRQNEWLHDHYVDHAIYGLLMSEWKPR